MVPKFLKERPVWSASIAFFLWLLWTLPEWLATVWPVFVRDKTIPEWLSERRWPGMSVTVTGIVSVIGLPLLASLVVWAIFASRSRRLSDLPKTGREQKASELELRTAQNQVNTLTQELWYERAKVARYTLRDFGKLHQGLEATVRFIDHADANQADHVAALLRDLAGWPCQLVMGDGATLRRSQSHRIEITSGNPENANQVASALNHGRLLGEEPVGAVEIIDSADDNITVNIFPRSSMPKV